MKNYIISLSAYTNSMIMAQRALTSGQQHGWNIELFEGVDGSITRLQDFNISVCQTDAKCRAMMERPGVQGCFLSHWKLWNRCADLNETIGIFEHDIEFLEACPEIEFDHVLKLEGFLKKKARPAGEWYEGARAYILCPAGAQRLIDWVDRNGALPADVNIGLDIVDIKLGDTNCVQQHALYGKTDKRENSFTWNLNTMEKI
jgi:GR25 family glycosyltransferase involved in LPS biosynthesis